MEVPVSAEAQRWSHSAGRWLLTLRSTVALFPHRLPECQRCRTTVIDLVLLSDMWSPAYGSPRRREGWLCTWLQPPRAALQDGPDHPALASAAFSRLSTGPLPWLLHLGNQGPRWLWPVAG